jgi:hypothetical protein
MKLVAIVVTLLGTLAVSSQAESQTYQSVSLDSAGQLSITLGSGSVVTPPKLQDQLSFRQPLVSGDHRTVGWLANYADSAGPQGTNDPIAGRLVLYRAGHVLRTFGTDQIFWSWGFVNQNQDIAFCTGPTHGGASGCELHRISSGLLQAKWDTHSVVDPPFWVKGLDF